MALKPHFLHRSDAPEEMSQPNAGASSDALAGAPATYGDVPKLGAPLPGDLGKPILEHQQSTMAAIDPAAQQLQQAQAAERERQLAELKAARESGVLVQGRQGSAPADTVTTAPKPTAGGEQPVGTKLALDPTNDPNAQGIRSRSAISASSQRSRSDRACRSDWSCTRILYLLPAERVEMAGIKLGRLSDRTPVKIAITVTPDLDALLRDYLKLYQATYADEAATVADLIPAIVAQFLAADRAFAKSRASSRDASPDA